MDSGAEFYFARFLEMNNIKWKKNNSIYFKYLDGVKERKYYPDFYLEEYDVWVEIKGRFYQSALDTLKLASVPTKIFYLISNDFQQSLPKFLDILKEGCYK